MFEFEGGVIDLQLISDFWTLLIAEFQIKIDTRT